jgi:hypothetical protein
MERGHEGYPETYTKRQATQHGCLPSLLGERHKENEIVYGEEKIFCTGLTRAAKAEQKSLVLAGYAQRTNEPTKEGHLSLVLFEPPFTSVSPVSRGYPSPVSVSIESFKFLKISADLF